MIIGRKKHGDYKREFSDRYGAVHDIFDGRMSTSADRYHGISGKSGGWSNETLDSSFIVDNLKLRLAISDLETMLKELKQLAK